MKAAALPRSSSRSVARSESVAARAEIRDLISFRIHAVANLLSRGAALRYRREFGVSLMEWRTVALLGSHQPASLNELAHHAGLDKSQMSRVVAGLTERGLVLRELDAEDARGVRLSLTRAGRQLYEGLIAAANERNRAFAAALDVEQHALLDAVLGRLADKARELIRTEPRRRPQACNQICQTVVKINIQIIHQTPTRGESMSAQLKQDDGPAAQTGIRRRMANRVELVPAYRLVAHFRMTDLIYTHISARVPGRKIIS